MRHPSSLRLPVFALLLGLLPQDALASVTSECRTLNCRNGGVCRQAKHTVSNDGITPSNSKTNVYCHCPPGYAGPFCEIKYQPCPQKVESEEQQERNATAFCNNGSPCDRDVDHDDQVYFHCECDESITDYSTLYARRACQHASTVFCTGEKQHQSLGQASGSYCRNGGTCKLDPNEQGDSDRPPSLRHAGCNCPASWGGAHCEELLDMKLAEKFHYFDEDENDVAPFYNSTYSRGYPGWRKMVFTLCIIVILVMVGGIAYNFYDDYRQSRERRKRRMEKATRIPKHVGTRNRKTKKFKPMEIGDPGDH